jgi:hypothetical protein
MHQGFIIAFGWRIDKLNVEKGEVYNTGILKDTAKEDIVDISLYTKGIISGVHSNNTTKVKTRTIGFFNSDLPEILPKGVIQFTVQEDAEWFCINYGLNSRKLPNVNRFQLKRDESKELLVGTKLFICSGKCVLDNTIYEAQSTIEVLDSPKTITASSDVLAFEFF